MTDNPAQPKPVGAATLIGMLAILLWAGLALLTAASGAVPPFELAALTFAIGGGFGLVFAAARGKLGALVQPWPVWLVGVGGLFGYHALYFAALRRAPPAQASLIAYLWPLLIVLFSALLPGERLAARHIVGALVGFAGAVALFAGKGGLSLSGEGVVLTGYALALCCAFVWSG
jgi:drug/metabolite transporter (DMT)-like permease